MSLPHVFARTTVTVGDLGYPVTVHGGTCWLADDALVKARPDLFTEDCRYAVGAGHDRCGCGWTGDTPEVMLVPEDAGIPAAPQDESSSAAMTRGTRAKSKTERALGQR